MKVLLSGMPELRLGLNDKVLFENTGSKILFCIWFAFGLHLGCLLCLLTILCCFVRDKNKSSGTGRCQISSVCPFVKI